MKLVIVGPTASGKTSLSIDLAHHLGGPEAVEIIGADAMQLYRGMDIGTAKASIEERRGIIHHQIDVLDIAQEASVSAYQDHGRADMAAIVAAGKTPLVVGGSGLYVSALLDEIEFPGTDPAVRAFYEHMHAEKGDVGMHRLLAEVDPESANVIDPRNRRRVIRALEVNKVTGSSFQPRFPRHTSHYDDVVMIGLERDKDEIADLIERRTTTMFDSGLIEETQALRDRGLDDAPTARRATGYAEALNVLDGTMTREEAQASVSMATRRLVKKQYTWFRRDPRITWFSATNTDEIVRFVDSMAS